MRIERLCPICRRVITDRTLTKCPNFRRHVAAHERATAKTSQADSAQTNVPSITTTPNDTQNAQPPDTGGNK